MKYRVVLTARAQTDLYHAALWWAENRDPHQAASWLEKFEAAIANLESDPQHHPVARENDRFEYTLRRLTFGMGKRATHRALFEIRSDIVYVRSIRHLHQDEITPEDLG